MQGSEEITSLSVVGHLSVRWDSEVERFYVRVWVRDHSSDDLRNLTPEWAEVIVLEDDEWCARTLTKYVTSLAQVTRAAGDDLVSGQLRLL